MLSIDTRPETDTTPRAWIGCLACYSAGRLVGDWFDGIEAGEVTTEDVHESSGYSGPLVSTHEELWVMDHEGYGPLIPGECSPAEAQDKAELLDSVHDADAFLAYVDHVGAEHADVDGFEEMYAGEWDSEEDYAADLLDSLGELTGDSLAVRYFDMAAFTRDLFMSDYASVPAPGLAVYVFRNY